MPRLLDAYRNGGGVSWAEFGSDIRTGQAEMNRPWFIHELGSSWLPSVPDINDRLLKGGRVADVGCGEGWSTIAMAKAYPNATFDGYDIDLPSIQAARHHALAVGVSERVRFEVVDVATLETGSDYDLVTAFECIHDLPDPVSVLNKMRQMSKDDGHVLVMDEAVGERFGERTDEVERLMYGFSLFVCLPDGMSHESSVATGTVMRLDTLKDYAFQAGFSDVNVLPIENDLWRFYELRT
jgi:SAM-dependent methyltransferase